MKGLCYIKQFSGDEWIMGFRFILRHDDANINDVQDEWTTLGDAVKIAYETQKREKNSLQFSDFVEVTYQDTFSLGKCGLRIPSKNVNFELRMLDPINALLGGKQALSGRKLLSLSIAELFVRKPLEISWIVYATSPNYQDLEDFAKNLGDCPNEISQFVSDQYAKNKLSSPYFRPDGPQIVRCNQPQNIPTDFYNLPYYK